MQYRGGSQEFDDLYADDKKPGGLAYSLREHKNYWHDVIKDARQEKSSIWELMSLDLIAVEKFWTIYDTLFDHCPDPFGTIKYFLNGTGIWTEEERLDLLLIK